MAVYKCSACGHEITGRCRPKECEKCGAPKEEFKKVEKE